MESLGLDNLVPTGTAHYSSPPHYNAKWAGKTRLESWHLWNEPLQDFVNKSVVLLTGVLLDNVFLHKLEPIFDPPSEFIIIVTIELP